MRAIGTAVSIVRQIGLSIITCAIRSRRTRSMAARDLVRSGHNTTLGDIRIVPQPVKCASTPPPDKPRSPTLGEDTEAVLAERLGLNTDQIRALGEANII
jgi:crotonobetainyl-CoA:carnitine CoA-transferase CaiB-like acyl-CoA transferase